MILYRLATELLFPWMGTIPAFLLPEGRAPEAELQKNIRETKTLIPEKISIERLVVDGQAIMNVMPLTLKPVVESLLQQRRQLPPLIIMNGETFIKREKTFLLPNGRRTETTHTTIFPYTQ